MAEEPPLSPCDNSSLSHKRRINDLLPSLDLHHASASSSEMPLSLSPPPCLQLKSSTLELGPTETQQQTQSSLQQSPKKAKFLQVSVKLGDEVGSSNSSEKLNLQGEDTIFQCELEKLDVGFVQKEVIDDFLGIKDEVGVVMKVNSSEKVNLSQSDGGNRIVELGFEYKCENFDGLLQNSAMSEDLTSSLMIDVINDTTVVDILKVEGKKNQRRGKKDLKNTGFLGVDDSNVGKSKCVYSRKDLEVLRYVNVKAQKKFWQEIYDGFEFKGENFDGLLQNSAMSEDLTSSLMIDVIDDTAAVDVLKVEGKKNRRRGKNVLKNTGFLGVGDSYVGKSKCVHTRKDMEVLRYVNVKAQKKFWQEIYDGFSTIVKKEYDELGSFRHKKHGGSISGHYQTGGKRNCNNGGIMGTCSTSLNYNYHGILGESCMNCAEEIVCSSKSACDVDNGHNGDENGGDLVGEWSEDEGSDDEYENIQRPAFKVDGEPDFESGPPEDGLEYLRRVRWEAKQIPKVKVAKLNNIKVKDQSVYMPMIPDIEECPPHLAPLRTWEDEFIADFSNLRVALSRLEDSSSGGSVDSESVIFARHELKSQPSKNLASLELTTSGGPMMSTVLAMDPVTRVAMLRRHISLFETSCDLSKDECGWLFALCAIVGTPLDADTCASLRCLLRRCAKLRAEKTEVDDEVAMLNVMATISGRCFGQLEN